MVGTLALVVIVALSGQAGGLGSPSTSAGTTWSAGLLGAVYVTMALIAVSSIGAGGVAAATITGQLAASVVIDRLGILGLEQTPLSASRIAGVALLLSGTYLVVR